MPDNNEQLARDIERNFAIAARLQRRMRDTKVRPGHDPFEEPGHVPLPPDQGKQREYAIPSRLLLFCAKERFTAVDFIPTIGGALMYENLLVGFAIVIVGMGAKWWTSRQIARYL